jgi:hypothetical protein
MKVATGAVPGSRELIEGQATFFAKPDVYPVDDRGVAYSFAYFSPKHLGTGSFYLLTIAGKDGRLLDGATTYRLTGPSNAPVTQYWSATVYDRATHAPIRNARWPSRSSQTHVRVCRHPAIIQPSLESRYNPRS